MSIVYNRSINPFLRTCGLSCNPKAMSKSNTYLWGHWEPELDQTWDAHSPPKTITHPGIREGFSFPGPQAQVWTMETGGGYTEKRGGFLSKLPQPPKIKEYLMYVCTHVYHTTNCFDEMWEPGVKPVYTLFPQFCKARFKLDVAENSCERLKPCESTLNVFSGHLVLLRTVWGCLRKPKAAEYYHTSKIFSTDMMEWSSHRDQQHIVLL